MGIYDDPRPPQLKYDPTHPNANEQGYVSTPNINLVEEMVNMISATRSYEAGIAAINSTKTMALKALEMTRDPDISVRELQVVISQDQALAAAEYTNRDETGAEPVPWFAVKLYEYDLVNSVSEVSGGV